MSSGDPMRSIYRFTVGGVLLGLVGSLVANGAVSDSDVNRGALWFGLLLLALGTLVALVGIIGWGVSLGTQHLRDADAARPRPSPAAARGHSQRTAAPGADTGRPRIFPAALARFAPPSDATPGWKDDPAVPGEQERRWDGTAWSEDVRAPDIRP